MDGLNDGSDDEDPGRNPQVQKPLLCSKPHLNYFSSHHMWYQTRPHLLESFKPVLEDSPSHRRLTVLITMYAPHVAAITHVDYF
jgi:hypothetical protein